MCVQSWTALEAEVCGWENGDAETAGEIKINQIKKNI